ncbi:tRNA-dihydrouridine synthase [candidate division WWE3 bacterium]|nr:tRNA-dihydrouridine synthase [candidate division WWE3 bacterium]
MTNQNIWQTIKKPCFILAPMEDVTDTVFRQIVGFCGAPDIYFTEFTSVDGINSPGKDHVIRRLMYTETERPLIAQIWGKNPENYYKAAQMLVHMKFDGIDINMGCPDASVIKQGCCSALIENQSLASEIIKATQEGAASLPVSVKTRIGFRVKKTEEWLSFLLNHNLAALTVHGRTASEMSKVPAQWDEIAKAVEIKKQLQKDTIIIGNGDVLSYADGLLKVEQAGVDGVMIGRGIFSNPWIFNTAINPEEVTIKQRLELLIRHVELFDVTWGTTKNFDILKKFFKIYVSGFSGAHELRSELMNMKAAPEVLQRVREFLSQL